MTDTEWSASEAERLVKPLGRRWLHVQAVAKSAADVAIRADLDPGLLVSAAWLHDIGYAAWTCPALVDTR